MTLQELEYFYDLAQTLNYSVTAERLFVSQPVVSKHIQLLEESLGFLLIDRTIRRRIRLTQSGELLFKCLQTCRGTWNDTLEKIREEQEMTQITFYMLEDQIVPRKLFLEFDNFRKKFTKNTPIFKTLEKEHIKAALKNGDFMIIPDFYEVPGKYKSRIVGSREENSLVLISSNGHPAAGKEPSAYSGSPLFIPGYMPSEGIQFLRKVYTKYIGVVPGVLILDNPATLVMYMLTDRGITINTNWYAWMNDPRLSFVPLPVAVRYHIAWDPETSHPSQVLSMIRQIK